MYLMPLSSASVIKPQSQAAASLERIHFVGVGRTKRDALVKETRELFAARTVKELVTKCYEAKQHLEEVGLFKGVAVVVDVDRRRRKEDGYEVTFVVREPRANRASVNAGVNNRGEVETVLAGAFPSTFGRGEVLSMQGTYGHKHTLQWNLGLEKPLLGWQRHTNVNAFLFRDSFEWPWNKSWSSETGVRAEVLHRSRRGLLHQLAWTGAWRQLGAASPGTAFDVRRHSGHNVKSGLQLSHTFSTMDRRIIPTRGVLLKFGQELAGLGGDIRFLRHDLELKSSSRFLLGTILAAGFRAAHVLPRSGPTLHLADRLYLGGHTSLRGFHFNSVGPASDGCYLGGTSSWEAAVHLYRPLFPPNAAFAHVFATAGNLHGVQHDATFPDELRRLATDPRVAVGAGLSLRVADSAMLELNYCVPIRYRADDKIHPGVQFGIGISFL